MATSIFLYPSLTDTMRESIFQAKKFAFSYTGSDGFDRDLDYETSEVSSSVNCLRTDGVWSADKNNLFVKRTIALKNYRILFGPDGIACRNARLGLSLVWTSPDSRQRGAEPVVDFGVCKEQFAEKHDHTFTEGEIDLEFGAAKIRGDVNFSVVLYIAKAGTPEKDETHLANEEGFVLGTFDSFTLRIDGTGSLFPVFEVYEKDQPLWYVRCDWTDPASDQFAESVSININTAHKNYKFIDRTQRTFCSQLLVEVMSAALCCIIEKIRSEQYLDQILGDEEMESGSVGEAVRYFSNTLGWDFSTPDKLSLSTRKFFDGRLDD
jgi:hypothetical protein